MEQENRSAYQDSCQSQPPKFSSEQRQQQENCQREALEDQQPSTTQSEKSRRVSPVISEIRMVAIGPSGARVGETAPNARYTDEDVDTVFRLREEGMSLLNISRIMDMPKSTVHAICSGRLRVTIPQRWERRKCRY